MGNVFYQEEFCQGKIRTNQENYQKAKKSGKKWEKLGKSKIVQVELLIFLKGSNFDA